MTERAEYERGDIEKFQLKVSCYISDELARDFALAPTAHLWLHSSLDMMVLDIKQKVYGETSGVLEIKQPATWFQMLKAQHAPCWLKRRWPVRYTTEKCDARALYPKLCYPGEFHNYAWVRKRD